MELGEVPVVSHTVEALCLQQMCTLSLTAAVADTVPSQAMSCQSFWPRSHSFLVVEQLPALRTAIPFTTTLRDLALPLPAGNIRLLHAVPTTASPPTEEFIGMEQAIH